MTLNTKAASFAFVSEPMCINVPPSASQEAVRRGLAAPKQTTARRSVDIQAPPDGRRNVGLQVLQVGATAPLWFSSRLETFPDHP